MVSFSRLNEYKWLLLFGSILCLCIVVILISIFGAKKEASAPPPGTLASPTPGSTGTPAGDLSMTPTTPLRFEGSSAEQAQHDKTLNEDYYPLIRFFPYSTSEYLLGYSDRRQLTITLKKPGLDRNRILTEVRSWVQNKGVAPDTHTYIFAGP